jgi:hypothetical protein
MIKATHALTTALSALMLASVAWKTATMLRDSALRSSFTVSSPSPVTDSLRPLGSAGESSVTTGSTPPPPPPNPGAAPELPRVLLNTAYEAPSGATIRVRAGESLQSAINNAKRGDVLLLEAGARFTGSFSLPAKEGTGWIVIRSDMSLPPEGTRVTPATAANFAKLVGGYDVTLTVESGASHYRIMGLEITTATSVTKAKRQIHMSPGSSHIIVDRSYVHGHPTLDFTRCIMMHATYAAVVDSWVSDCHANGFDSQAIAAWNTNGPLKIVNNHLAGAGENVMFGGAMPAEGVIPSDIEIRGNHFYKDPAWKGVWTVKNLFEIKSAQRVLLEGNVFENHWKHAQDGMAFNIKVSDQDGRCTWCVSQDITFRSNIVRNVDGGMKISNSQRVLIRNNLFEKLRAFGSNGRLFQIQGGASGVRIENNTGFGTYSIITAGETVLPGFVMTNNIVTRGAYGIKGSYSEGTETLTNQMPGHIFLGNVLISASSSRYPGQNFFPASMTDVGFVSPSTGDYRLQSSSPYKGKGTDGRDPGANIAELQAIATGG